MNLIPRSFVILTTFLTIHQVSMAKSELIEVASFGKNQPIGLTVSPQSNRVFVSFPHREPFLYGLTEIIDGKRVPFPDESWNQFDRDDPKEHFVNVQDLYADRENNLWVLDSAPAGNASIFGGSKAKEGQFKLIRIDLTKNQVADIYQFDDLPKAQSGLNDVRIDHTHQLAYLSDPAMKAIVVLDLKTGKSRVVLKNDPSTVAEPGFILKIEDREMRNASGHPFTSNVNGIALTQDDRFFYFHAINRKDLFRIETRYLADPEIRPEVLSEKVEHVAQTGPCHGMIADAAGNIYLTNSPDHAIDYLTPSGELKTLVTDERLSWPDSLGIGSDGFLYLSASQLNRLPSWNGGTDRVSYPFRVYKVKLPSSPTQ
ncbi:hypothetical protein JIN85_05905 [Luteolibacter pohnpeiensis]|uniref:Gluconolactonase n=1 Tax=Luteolibacter pohnpeiensis TaxID=454153 RepID=A0A934S688_9BACT|nr:L-dopachrome tautomerase-related protein [Luteolibacter pohnpeiensis]MBK1881939.1 hypothetical protein [Luteolibacter pohnpeiensis]